MMIIRYPDLAALVLRLGFGLYMLLGHGLSKFNMLLAGGEIRFPSVLGMPPKISLILAVAAEFIACIMIIIGYKTRLAALPMIITMLIAAFVIHSGDPWFMQSADGGSKEPALIYMLGFLSIYLLGSGKYSIDSRVDSIM
ncbi:MAG: DoxX family protein [Saprospiraceae bacterium]|nr:DoxX family protein [Bacteroidia bacterium]NNE14309.1 DoxX family protein [Saprospiraceae bacterium]NNL90843.1 DoxX family protein [Saprospiraceae bacterium]